MGHRGRQTRPRVHRGPNRLARSPRSNRGYQKANRGGVDAFIAQIGGPTTYFGGSQKDEAGYDGQNIAIDAHGDVWIAGMTYSTDLPAEGAYGGGDGDGFIAKFAPSLNKVRFASTPAAQQENSAKASRSSPAAPR